MAKSKEAKKVTQAIFVRISLSAFRKIKEKADSEKRAVGNYVALILEQQFDRPEAQ